MHNSVAIGLKAALFSLKSAQNAAPMGSDLQYELGVLIEETEHFVAIIGDYDGEGRYV